MATSTDVSLDSILPVLHNVEKLLTGTFGPNGLQNMICTSSGKLLITNHGWTSLDALHLSHPLLKIVLQALDKHCSLTGDQSKSFVLMLIEALRSVSKNAKRQCTSKEDMQRHLVLVSRSCSRFISDILCKLILPELKNCIGSAALCQENIDMVNDMCYKIVKTSLSGKFTRIVTKRMTELIVSFVFTICKCVQSLGDVLLLVIDNFHTMCIEVQNQPFSESLFVEGIVICKRFTLNCFPTNGEIITTDGSVKFVMLNCSLEGADSDTKTSFSFTDRSHLEQSLQWKRKYVHLVLQNYSAHGINLILSTFVLPDFVVSIAQSFKVSIVHAVEREDLEYLSLTSKTGILCDIEDFALSNIGHAKFCRPIICGATQYVHLGISTKTHDGIQHTASPQKHESPYDFISPGVVVLCGPTDGICKQYSQSMLSAIKCLRMWLYDHNINDLGDLVINNFQSIPKTMPCSEKVAETFCDSQDTNFKLKADIEPVSINATPNSVIKEHVCTCGALPCRKDDLCSNVINSEMTKEFTSFKVDSESDSFQYGLSIAGGGTFELFIYNYLTNYISTCHDPAMVNVCRMIQQAVLSIPRCLHDNSFSDGHKTSRFITILREAEEKYCDGKYMSLNGRSGQLEECHESEAVESFSAKWQLLLSVIQLIEQILRIDKLVSVKQSYHV